MTNTTAFFHADAAIIGRLGEELVAKQETALIELVKNSYDADATQVIVEFEGDGVFSAITLIDNGGGMTRAELTEGFLRLASDFKIRNPTSPKYGRRRAGRKGIGRFATQRLGSRLVLTSRSQSSSTGVRLSVNWDQFVSGRSLEQIPLSLHEVDDVPVGTTLRIEGLRDTWSRSQIRRCWRGVLALQQPFPVAPVEAKPLADPGFDVKFVGGGAGTLITEVLADIKTEVLQHLHAEIEMKVDSNGAAYWKLSKNKYGSTQDWTPIHHLSRDSPLVAPYSYLRNVWLKAFYFILDPNLFPPMLYARVRDVLSEDGGIRLYRNGFRVVPYGEKKNDWLGLDATYSKRAALVPISNKNFFGIVEIADQEGEGFEEHTSREGLIETDAFDELRSLISSVLITAATRVGSDRGRKTRAGGNRLQSTSKVQLGEVSAALDAVKRAGLGNSAVGKEQLDDIIQQVGKAEQLILQKETELREQDQRRADEISMLRLLATLGMVSAEFNHETGMAFDAFRADFAHVVEVASACSPNDTSFQEQAERVKRLAARLDALTAYLTSLASARAVRELSPQSVARALDDFKKAIVEQARSQDISVELHLPSFDPLFVRPVHRAELASVFLNLYTNAVKAVKRQAGERLISVSAARLANDESRIRIVFQDTGDGIQKSVQEQVFEPFFTTSMAPSADASDDEHLSGTGLGLWIVQQIVENAGGEISVIEADEGFSTAFEVLLIPQSSGGD